MTCGRPKGISCIKIIRLAVRKTGSQSALAKAIGMTRAAVSLWMRGKARPSKRAYKKLLKVVR